MSFDKIALLLVLALGFLSFLFLKKRGVPTTPRVYTSSLSDFIQDNPSIKARLASLPKQLLALSAILMVVAFLDPHTFEPKKENKGIQQRDPTEGRVMFLALDQSGSMLESGGGSQSKMDLMKSVTSEFVKDRPQDLIGLISFARSTQILSPPTLDHQELLKEISQIQPVPTMDLDGTAIGYAIYKSANLISSLKEQADYLGKSAPYQIKGTVIVLVTDGLQDPNPLDKDNPYRSMELQQAADYARSKGVKLYVINIEPKLASAQYLPNLREMQRVAESTQGKFYHAHSPNDLTDFLDDINRIEVSKIYESADSRARPSEFKRISYSTPFLLLSLLFLSLGIFLRQTYLRQVSE